MKLTSNLGDFSGLYVAIALAALPTAILHLILPSFGEVFSSFGTRLPPVTSALFRYYPAFLVCPLIVYSIWLLLPSSATRNEVMARIGMCICGAVIGLSVIVMYLPIFRLGSGG